MPSSLASTTRFAAGRRNRPQGLPLREGEPAERREPKLRLPEDALQGANSKGSTGWAGMHAPAGDPPHPYHVQVFALDRRLDLPPGAGRAEALAAMAGRVLAAGQLVGTYQR